ncbi:MAG: hypothetical protein ACR2GD_12765 [Pyrinomonadaceae bacterium]
MKQKVFLTAMAFVLLSAVAAFAQTKTNFSGNWTLDVSKSKVNNIESGTMNVTQTDKDITYKTDFKRTPRPDNGGGQMGGSGNGQGGGTGRGMGGGMAGGSQPSVYTLDGKEVTAQGGSSDRPFTSKMKSSWDGSKLNLTSVRTFSTPNGDITTTQKETWELADGGKTLKVHRESESPRGTQTSDFYYTKQ